MAELKNEAKYVNLSKKFKIDRDDFEAQFDRLTRYILQTYNFGSELVTLAFLELIRNGDVPEDISAVGKAGVYRREQGEAQSAENVIKTPSEIIASAIREKAASEKKPQGEISTKTEAAQKQLKGQINLFDQ